MHLRDALVDLSGNLFAEGTISFPPDPSGIFTAPQHTHVAIDRGGYVLRPVEIARDASNGFVLSNLLPLSVGMPPAIGALILRCIRYGLRNLQHFSWPNEDGSLSVIGGQETKGQRLADWQLDIAEVEDGIHVVLSAALRSTQVHWPLDGPPTNHWPAEGEALRLVVNLIFNNATRSAIGCYVRGIGDTASQGVADYPRTDTAHLCLAHAPVGPHGTYAISPDGQWFRIAQWNAEDQLSITFERLPCTPSRLAGGVISARPTSDEVDSISFRGWNLDSVAGQLARARSLTLRMKGRHATGQRSLDGRWYQVLSHIPDQHVIEAQFKFVLDRHGLTISYKALINDLHFGKEPYQSGTLQAEMYLSWEVLVLTVPAFLYARELLPTGPAERSKRPMFTMGPES